MSSNYFPSTGGKPQFNPNAAYEPVQGEPAPKGKKPAFNPKASYEEVQADKPSAQPVFQVQISGPSFGAKTPTATTAEGTVISASGVPSKKEFTYTKPTDVLAAEKLQGKAAKAHENLQVELKGNRDIKEKMIRQRRFDEFSEQIPISRTDMPKVQSALDVDRIIERPTKPQDLPVTDDDLIKEDEAIQNDRGKAVRLLEETMRSRPEKAKDIQKNVYLIDAFNSLNLTPEVANERAAKIEENAKQLSKGNLIYDPRSNRLIKPLGLMGSFLEGWKQDQQLLLDNDFLRNTKNNSAILSEYHARQKDVDMDAPIPVPKGRVSEVFNMLGSMPYKPLAAGAIASFGGPQAGLAAGAVVGGREVSKREYPATFWRTLDELIKEGVPEHEAVEKARFQAEQAAEIGAIVGGASGLIGVRSGMQPIKQMAASNSFRQAAFNVLKTSGSELGKAGLEGLAAGGIGAAGEIYKNKLAQEAGIKRDITEGVAEQIEGNLLMTVGMAAAIKAGRGMSKMNYRTLLHGISKLPDEQINGWLQNQVENGTITQEAADQGLNTINEYKQKDSQIPPNVTEEARFKIQDNIDKLNELEAQKESTHKSLQEPIKEKIQKLEEQNLSLLKETEKPEKPESGLTKSKEKEAIETAEEFLAEGIFPEIYASEIKKDPIGFWKTIAQQAQNRDEKWRPLSEQLDEQAVRDQFGDTVVDYAKELFPAPELSTENVSVIMPEEVKRPETITIKPKEDESIRQRIPEATVVDETPRNSAEMESGIPESGEATIPQEGQPAVEAESTPPGQEGQVGEPEMVGITHAEMDKVSRDLGLPEYTKDPETFEGWTREAKDRMAKDSDALNKLINKLRRGDMPDPVETQMMKMHFAALKERYNNNPTPELLAEINRTKDLYNIAGREEGKRLVARKGLMPVEDTLADFHMTDIEFNRGAPLTEEQTAQSTKEYNEIKAAKTALDEKIAKLEADNARLKAEKKIAAEAKAAKKGIKKDYKEERAQILKDISEKWKKSSKENIGASFVPYAKELAAIAPDVMKLVKNIVEEGIEKLPDVIQAVHKQVKDILPQITEKDVHDIIAGEYTKKQTRNQLAQQLYDLRKEASLMNELDQLLNGQIPVSQRKQRARNQRIEELRNQIKGLKDDLGLNDRTDAEKLASLKGRYKTKIKEIEDKIAKGDYGPDEKPEPIKLDKEAQDLKDQYIKVKADRQRRLAQQEYENRTLSKKIGDKVTEVLNVPRTVMASVDLSAPLRQGLVMTTSHPKVASKAFVESVKQAVSPARFDRWLHDLKESDYYKNVIEKSGLYVADPNNLHLSAKEEAFMTNLAEKIPVLGKLVSMSERAYVAYLNKMRVDIFKSYADNLADQGMTPENAPEVYEALGTFLNSATGRGELGKLEPAAQVLNTAFFSPRLIASRINMLNPLWYSKLPAPVRRMAIKDMAKMIGIGATTVGLFSLIPGVEVEKDPRSTDFGKIKVGNTRYDTWGGFQQYVRLFSQLLSGFEKKTDGRVVPLGTEHGQKTRADKVLTFFRGKLAPVPSMIGDVMAGKTATGEEVELTSEMKDHLIPMIVNDVKEAWKEQGPMSLIYTGLPSFLGVGTSTFAPKETGGTSKKQKKEGKPKKPTKNTKN